MMTALAVLLAASVIASVLAAVACKCPREETAHRASHTESAKDAHYMRNFWNYDGSEQEEFDA